LLEASREKQTTADVASRSSRYRKANRRTQLEVEVKKDDALPPEARPEAGGKTLNFLTKDGDTVVVDSENEAQVIRI